MILRVVAAKVPVPVPDRPLLDDGPVFGPLRKPQYFGR